MPTRDDFEHSATHVVSVRDQLSDAGSIPAGSIFSKPTGSRRGYKKGMRPISSRIGFGISAPLFLAVGFLGCGEQECTLIGCSDSLYIRVRTADSMVVGTFTGTITADGTSQQFACPSARCDGNAFVFSDTPNHVRVEVSTPSASGSVEIDPIYEESRPNGPNCSPVCKSGQLEVTVR